MIPAFGRSEQISEVTPGLHTLRPEQNGRQFTDNIFKCIFFNEKSRILIQINWSLSTWQLPCIDSDNGLVSNKWQAISWPNVDHVLWRYMVSLGLKELKHWNYISVVLLISNQYEKPTAVVQPGKTCKKYSVVPL